MRRFVRRIALLVAGCAVPTLCLSSPLPPSFGAFGYPGPYQLAFFQCDESTITFAEGRAIRYSPAGSDWSVQRLSCLDKVIVYRPQSGYPVRARLDAASSSISLEYRDGFLLEGTGSPPLLTWADASAGAGVPTPRVGWVAMSWQEGGPIVLLRFASRPVSVVVAEQERGWTLRTEEPYAGWVHLWMPLGVERLSTRTAADLGRLAARLRPVADSLTDVPRAVGWSVEPDPRGVTVTWEFDQAGVLIPNPVLSTVNRLRVKVLSNGTHLGTTTAMRSAEATLRLRFLARRLLPGRAVTSGERSYESFNLDEPTGVSEAALAFLWNRLSPEDERVLRASVKSWRAGLPSVREPFTNLQWPGGKSRESLDEFAAYALADLVLFGSPEGVKSLAAALEWTSWTLGASAEALFATNVLAVAGAVSEDPALRAMGAVAAAGARDSEAKTGFESLRDAIYPIASVLDLEAPSFLTPALSPVRVLGGEQIEVRQQADGAIVLETTVLKPSALHLTLKGVGACEVVSKFNLEAPALAVAQEDLQITLQPRRAGYLKLVLSPLKPVSCPPSAPSPRCNVGPHFPSEPGPARR